MNRIALLAMLMVVTGAGTVTAQQTSVDARAERAEDLIAVARQRQALTETLAGLHQAAASNAEAGDAVSYSISGRLAEDASSGSPLPVGIVSVIRADVNLKSMNVASSEGGIRMDGGAASLETRPSFSAAFGFKDLNEFQTWYSSYGEALHQAIDRAGAEDVRFDLSVVRSTEPEAVVRR